MACEQIKILPYSVLGKKLVGEAYRRRIPLGGVVEITDRCNFNCRHCYLGVHPALSKGRDIPADLFLATISELKDAGCLFLLLSGGEPLLHPDFARMYRAAARSGFVVSLFTNASLLTERAVSLLRENPPLEISCTLYGATRQTYDVLTQTKGAFELAMRGMERAREAGLRVHAKAMVLRSNLHEMERMKEIARSFGKNLFVDLIIYPDIHGGKFPLEERLAVPEIVDIERKDPKRRTEYKRLWRDFQEARRSDELFLCSAGRSCFGIDSRGFLHPCIMVRWGGMDLAKHGFKEAWKRIGDKFLSLRLPEREGTKSCVRCRLLPLCDWCPMLAKFESGSAYSPVKICCEMGEARHRAFISVGRKTAPYSSPLG